MQNQVYALSLKDLEPESPQPKKTLKTKSTVWAYPPGFRAGFAEVSSRKP